MKQHAKFIGRTPLYQKGLNKEKLTIDMQTCELATMACRLATFACRLAETPCTVHVKVATLHVDVVTSVGPFILTILLILLFCFIHIY